MDYVVVFKAADDVNDRIHLTDVGQELVSQSFTLARTFHKPSDVDKFHPSGNDFRTTAEIAEQLQPGIRHSHRADIGLDRAEREIGCLGLSVGDQGVEKSGFAHVGQSDDSGFKHAVKSIVSGSFYPVTSLTRENA